MKILNKQRIKIEIKQNSNIFCYLIQINFNFYPDDSKYKSKLLIIKLITNVTYKYKDRNDVIIIHIIQLNRDVLKYKI